MVGKALSQELVQFLGRSLAFYKSFLQLETEKYNDIAENRVDLLLNHIKEEEAYILQARGFELERSRIMAKLPKEYAEKTFRQLLPFIDQQEYSAARTVYKELSDVILDLKAISQRCSTLTDLRLRRTQKRIHELECSSHKISAPAAYAADKAGGRFSQKI